jgi:hypothetical protein
VPQVGPQSVPKTTLSTPLASSKTTTAIDADKIAEFVARGNVATLDKRLINPAGNNALSFYQQALALSPNNPAALQGIAQVQRALLSKAQ